MLAPRATVAGLHDRSGVEGRVELTVSGPVEPVPADVAAGRLDRCGPGVAGEVALGLETGHGAGVADDLGRQNVADALDLGQRRAAPRDFDRDRLGHGLELTVGTPQVVEEVPGDRLALNIGGRKRTDSGQKGSCGGGRQLAGGAAGLEVAQKDL